ncbi:MAG: FAD-dependent oxidoreductase, partial [Deltaproteobacteria bacterium]|nr:FAD-dependent oxidoreductase [Deltaproteobacteria bacterium]
MKARSIPALERDGLSFSDLFNPHALAKLDRSFCDWLGVHAPSIQKRLREYRSRSEELAPEERSRLLVEAAPWVGAFVASLFGVEAEREQMMHAFDEESAIFRMQDELYKRRALKRQGVGFDANHDAWMRQGMKKLGIDPENELEVAKWAVSLLDAEAKVRRSSLDEEELDEEEKAAVRKAALAFGLDGDDPKSAIFRLLSALESWLVMNRGRLPGWVCFDLARPIDPQALVPTERLTMGPVPLRKAGKSLHLRHRDGFALTDPRMSRREVRNQVEYCLYCHERKKDSCSKGFRAIDGRFKTNALGVPLTGCPLEEKISEAHFVYRQGDAIGALALILIDNPMAPGTGHRICNECMRACIFQKQEPVNIPQIETRILVDVLSMRWGVEIYGLLTRWNPLRPKRPYPLPYHGHNVLVVGLGPAGYTLSHWLSQEGFGVIAIDALKIEPLPKHLLEEPIEHYEMLFEALEERVIHGFGGVSEYGITVRWDKNFLKLIYLELARRPYVRLIGGVRFGGTIRLEDAWSYGFDHVAIAGGAGRPTILKIQNNLARGMRQASDFLMSLQLTGAYKHSSLAALQVRLPALVIGGGLTAIDTATELRAYYVVQCEKVLAQWEEITEGCPEREEKLLQRFDEEERAVLAEFLEHGRMFRKERESAQKEGRNPNFDPIIESLGGVTIVYRRKLEASPAYRLNHEEVIKALEEGIRFAEDLAPVAAIEDQYGALCAMRFRKSDGSEVELPARTVCVAAGTAPNITYECEHPGTFKLGSNGYFAMHRAFRDAEGRIHLEEVSGPSLPGPEAGFFTSYLDEGGHTVSFYGDNHPLYVGSVVRAMASAKHGHQAVQRLFAQSIEKALELPEETRLKKWHSLVERFEGDVRPRVVRVECLA